MTDRRASALAFKHSPESPSRDMWKQRADWLEHLEHLKILRHTYREVKAEFSDLDGLRWTREQLALFSPPRLQQKSQSLVPPTVDPQFAWNRDLFPLPSLDSSHMVASLSETVRPPLDLDTIPSDTSLTATFRGSTSASVSYPSHLPIAASSRRMSRKSYDTFAGGGGLKRTPSFADISNMIMSENKTEPSICEVPLVPPGLVHPSSKCSGAEAISSREENGVLDGSLSHSVINDEKTSTSFEPVFPMRSFTNADTSISPPPPPTRLPRLLLDIPNQLSLNTQFNLGEYPLLLPPSPKPRSARAAARLIRSSSQATIRPSATLLLNSDSESSDYTPSHNSDMSTSCGGNDKVSNLIAETNTDTVVSQDSDISTVLRLAALLDSEALSPSSSCSSSSFLFRSSSRSPVAPLAPDLDLKFDEEIDWSPPRSYTPKSEFESSMLFEYDGEYDRDRDFDAQVEDVYAEIASESDSDADADGDEDRASESTLSMSPRYLNRSQLRNGFEHGLKFYLPHELDHQRKIKSGKKKLKQKSKERRNEKHEEEGNEEMEKPKLKLKFRKPILFDALF